MGGNIIKGRDDNRIFSLRSVNTNGQTTFYFNLVKNDYTDFIALSVMRNLKTLKVQGVPPLVRGTPFLNFFHIIVVIWVFRVRLAVYYKAIIANENCKDV